MNKTHAFAPGSNTVNLSAGTTTGNVQVQTANYSPHLRVYNSGSVTVFINFGVDNTVTATLAAGLPIPPGAVEILSCPYPYVAAITTSSTATIYFTPGEGL